MKNTLSECIRLANEVHNFKYDYSLIKEYVNNRTKCPIICPEHGVFYKDFYHHIYRGDGCKKCSGRYQYTTEEFVDKVSKLPHCSTYTFENTVYVNNKTKITVTCHEKDENGCEHGQFEITPGHLLSGEGCPKCRYIKSSSKNRRSIQSVIEEAKKVHGDKYDYSMLTEYKNDRIKYPIICPEHGVFYQTMNNHIKGKQGCPVCGRIKCGSERLMTTEEWVQRAREVHGDKYDYTQSVYENSRQPLKIICPIHGEFEQIAGNHLFGQGCPKCFKDKSTVEKELLEYIKSLLPSTEVLENVRDVIPPKEIDIFIPGLNIGFEMNGLIWHSEKFNTEKKYHLLKTEECEKKGIRLIQIFDDEWMLKNSICKSRIRNILGFTEKKIYARNCRIAEVDSKTATRFLDRNHIQGKTQTNVRIGLFYEDELVSVMAFCRNRINLNGKPRNDKEYELVRFANMLGTTVVGGASRMFKYFVETYSPEKVKSFADRRWSNGNLYEKIGFEFEENTPPSYFYVINKRRVNRFNMRKDVLIRKYGCPSEMTEKEFCESKGWYRVYDCGTRKYIWTLKKQDI